VYCVCEITAAADSFIYIHMHICAFKILSSLLHLCLYIFLVWRKMSLPYCFMSSTFIEFDI